MSPLRNVLALALLLCLVVCCLADSRGSWGVPAPGYSYGGLPYGSVSGNVASYYSGSDRGAVLPAYQGARGFGGGFNYLRR
ncbi:4-hydroxy-3-methylbut-2-en-1-yl diphosphate synthase (ferredoxin), chloroplastic [Frankliniella fusca]|uniref:4-hydroxy-3-methylbut-2-en-1-yl diphosphate synthase (Ferredoxin), chloroplastic n=1 Tax=Frankliniella fusca TaxID=407009 RepID=A0AAE1HU11_9NEOP|nr:4-hydroxy-3-methylbut-2-en-1-yl diphosphate synthase (ferredoxin), chloroplastic [Frankliniella fusca]